MRDNHGMEIRFRLRKSAKTEMSGNFIGWGLANFLLM